MLLVMLETGKGDLLISLVRKKKQTFLAFYLQESRTQKGIAKHPYGMSGMGKC